MLLQQCLPFTVLKHAEKLHYWSQSSVATVLTVYGIETLPQNYAGEFRLN